MPFKGRKHSPETINKMRESRLLFYKNGGVAYFQGKKRPAMSEEQRLKMSIAHKGKKMSEETKQKIGKANTGEQNFFFGKNRFGENAWHWKGGFDQSFFNRKRRNILKNAEGFHTESEWLDLKNKFNNMCLCCKKFEPEIKLTRDHIVPLKFGGTDFISNIQPLCLSCNCRKHTKTINFIHSHSVPLVV